MDIWYNTIDFLTSLSQGGEFQYSLKVFKALFLLVSLVSIVIAIWFRSKSDYFSDLKLKYSYYRLKSKTQQSAELSPLALGQLKDYWQNLISRLHHNDPSQWKLALIEADNFFEYALSLLGYQGEGLAEKIKQLEKFYAKSLNSVWQAHKIRNAMVHEPNFQISFRQAEEALNAYEEALKELKILE